MLSSVAHLCSTVESYPIVLVDGGLQDSIRICNFRSLRDGCKFSACRCRGVLHGTIPAHWPLAGASLSSTHDNTVNPEERASRVRVYLRPIETERGEDGCLRWVLHTAGDEHMYQVSAFLKNMSHYRIVVVYYSGRPVFTIKRLKISDKLEGHTTLCSHQKFASSSLEYVILRRKIRSPWEI